ncbi:hypothetical protein LSH36_1105g00042 [Paralvinella palmiformis]|uniref:Uncharacterized protein n=1 Tax=Paralvinella palmiformis TaxID=53620 RepID=A0AAD9MQ83_9ANNE|nr:hypothetical protein LSH36_1105g00042 [Paralvinella palmiformis]
MMAIHGLVLTSECRRTCLLTKGCLGFNMQWIRKGADVGYCDLVDMRLVNSLSSKSNYSLYARCPFGMIFHSTTNRCYKVVRIRKNWTESQQYCRSLNDQAHLMEIYDWKQQELFKHMTKDLTECTYSTTGIEYRGHQNHTMYGTPCQNWSSKYPHDHAMFTKPLAWLLEDNYCRNVDYEARPWCYTVDVNKRWEYCDIPYCSDFIETKPTKVSIGLWLGATRSVENTDVVWSTTLESVIESNYSNFEFGETTGQDSENNCLKSDRSHWSMASCFEIKPSVGEYRLV